MSNRNKLIIRRVLSILAFILWDFASVMIASFLFYPFYRVNVGVLDVLVNGVVSFAVAVAVHAVTGAYSSIYQRLTVDDIMRFLLSALSSTFAMMMVWAVRKSTEPDIAAATIYLIIVFYLFVTGRVFVRIIKGFKFIPTRGKNLKNTIIYGAGVSGTACYNRMQQEETDKYNVVAFLDDNPVLHGKRIGNAKVIGGGEMLKEIADKHNIRNVIIAIPTIDKSKLRSIVTECNRLGCSVKRYGTLEDIGKIKRAKMRDINMEELLHRSSVTLDMEAVKKLVFGKCVMVTGGVGSIGSELCRQALKFGCKKLIVFDINENGLFHMGNELKDAGYCLDRDFELKLGSVRDLHRLTDIMNKTKPTVVFHAAAHKHVPMVEGNPCEAIKNNVFGTINVCRAANESGADKVILISTDKAVNPTSVMGASKRIAELVIQAFNKSSSDTDYVAVRFGNVLGSEGSVVPIFTSQIERGGPVTVTHPDMTRYFMTILEAVQLVLEAGAMASGGEVFVLDMGEPVKIYDLACDLIRLYGYEPNKDINVVFSGIRPGEKLFEEINMDSENVTKTDNSQIFIMRSLETDLSNIKDELNNLCKLAQEDNSCGILKAIRQLVPSFSHDDIAPDN